MAHVEHYKQTDVKRLANEWTRDPAYKCTDGRIDPARTPLNYTADNTDKHGMKVRRTYTLMAALRARLGEVSHSKRKDLNVLSDWVITCPKELLGDDAKVKRFFEVAYGFTAERYGRENVLQGFVHMDETTPHMHVPMIPVKDGRVSAKALFTRAELSQFHKELDKVVAAEFGQKGLILNGRTKGNYTVKELKQRTKDEQAAEALRAESASLAAQNAAEQARLAEAVQRRLEAENAAEAALRASDEARDEVAALREQAAQVVAEARAAVKAMPNVPAQLGADDRRVLAAVKVMRGKDGKSTYERALNTYAQDGGKRVPRIAEDAAASAARRMQQLDADFSRFNRQSTDDFQF